MKKFSSIEEKRAYYREAVKKSYRRHKDDPGFKEKTRANARRTHARNRERALSDLEYAAKRRAYDCAKAKESYARKRQDPAWVESYRAKQRARHAKKPKHPRVLLSEDEKKLRRQLACKRWREENPEKSRAASLAYAKAHPERNRKGVADYRARHKRAPGTFTQQEWLDRVAEFNGCCAFCLQPHKLTVEHMQALTRGGTNDIENIIPACHSCNSRKKDRGMLYMATRIAA